MCVCLFTTLPQQPAVVAMFFLLIPALILSRQLSVSWKPVSGKWEHCVYWSEWNITHIDRQQVFLRAGPRKCPITAASGQKYSSARPCTHSWERCVRFPSQCVLIPPIAWIMMLMLFDRIWISVILILTLQKYRFPFLLTLPPFFISSGIWPGLHQPTEGGRGWRDQWGDAAAGVRLQGGLLYRPSVGAAVGGDA